VFQKLTSKIALAFLTDYPTPQSAAHLGEGRMHQFCRRHAYRGEASGRTPQAASGRSSGRDPDRRRDPCRDRRRVRRPDTRPEHPDRPPRGRHRRSARRASQGGPAREPSTRWHGQPGPAHRRGRSPTRPLPRSRTGRRHLWCRTHHPGIRQDPHRRVPLRGQQASAGCDHRLRRQLPALIGVGGAPLQPGPCPGSPPPSRRTDRRPRMAPHHLGVLAHQHRLRPLTTPRGTARSNDDLT
jgi:hypothetical protein